MPIMIWCAAIVELALENWADGGILLGILIINASIRCGPPSGRPFRYRLPQ